MHALERKCDKCGKVIVALYQTQLQYNFEQHMAKHERKDPADVNRIPGVSPP